MTCRGVLDGSTCKLLVVNVNRQPVSDAEVLTKQLDRVASVKAYPQPQAESQLGVRV